jgi:hypothetical protein
LLTGEVVVYRARLHPIVYVPAAFVGALALVIFIGGTAAGAAASSVRLSSAVRAARANHSRASPVRWNSDAKSSSKYNLGDDGIEPPTFSV